MIYPFVRYIILFTFLISVILPSAYAETNLNVEVNPNPDSINVGNNETISVLLKTNATQIVINSIDLVSPNWNSTSDMSSPITMNKHLIYVSNILVNVPANAEAGKYEMVVKVNTTDGDFFGKSTLTVSKIESISLTDIPVSIIAIMVTGFVVYFSIVLIITKKFDRSNIEITLSTITIGTLIWWFTVQRSLNNAIGSSFDDYLKVIFVSAAIIVFFFILNIAYRGIKKTFATSKKLNNSLNSLRLKGYFTKKGFAINEFLQVQLETSRKIGKKYILRVRIHLNNPVQEIEGMLWNYDDDIIPHNISIFPKYIMTCNKAEICNSLLANIPQQGKKDEKSLLSSTLEQDKEYFTRVKDRFGSEAKTSEELVNEIKDKLEEPILGIPSFVEILEKLEFGAYSYPIIKQLKNKNLEVTPEFPIYVNAENIDKIEVIGYETRYAIKLEENDDIIPKIYKSKDFLLLDQENRY